MSLYHSPSWIFLIFRGMKLPRGLILVFAIAGMLPPLFFRAVNWYNGDVLSSWPSFLGNMLTSVATTVLVSVGVVRVMIWLHDHYPWQKGILRRLFLEIVLTTTTAVSLIVLITLFSHLLQPKQDLLSALFRYSLVAIVLNFFLVALTEGVFFFRSWRESSLESERFQKESARAQLESLKNQVNPHFLFNSLNTLSSMIDVDQDQSKAFVDNLSQVYRYVLQHEKEEVVSLRTELDFIQAYAHLLKRRHGERIRFHFNVPPAAMDKGLPPLTLQLLVENAVKHNVASRQRPLHIEVFTAEDQLCVRNDLQSRRTVAPSTGIGLKNIQERYQFLVQRPIEVIKTEQHFEVRVPLISVAYQ